MSKSLRWAILGPGRIAPRLVRAIGASTRGHLAAVASRDDGRAAAFAATYGIAQAFGSYEALLQAPDLDVVYIALPNHLHAEWSVRALQAGKHVLCEKPLALTVEQVDAIAAASRRSGCVAVEAFMYLHHPQIRRAIELATDGTLGRLQLMVGTFSFYLAHPGDPRAEREMGGGSLWDVGCYPVSLARRIAGLEPDTVAGLARFDASGVDRTFIGQLRFPDGWLAQFDSGFAAPDRERVEIVGSDATIILDAPFLPEPDGPAPSLRLCRGRECETLDVPSVDQYRAEVDDISAVILDGASPRVSLDFSRGNVGTLMRLDESARQAAAGSSAPATWVDR